MLPFLLALAAASPVLPARTPAQDATPPSSWPGDIDLSAGQDLDEDYRRQFALCDSAGTFRGRPAAYRGCAGDPNRVTQLRRLPGGAVTFTAKLAVDLDGSPFACGPDHGRSDQCPTSLMLPGPDGELVPVDSDAVPYVVIPAAGPDGVRGEFGRLTGVGVGDYGVVVYHGRVVPVIVADTGPFSLLGEGSLALHRALGRELCARRDAAGVCRYVPSTIESIEGDVTAVLFPGSATPGLTAATLAQTVQREGWRLWRASPVSRTVRSATPPPAAGGRTAPADPARPG